MYKDAIETQDAYAINQYNACCRYLDIPASFDAEGETLLEKIVQLTEQRDYWKARCLQQNKDLGYELRNPNGTIWSECKRLQSELTKANEYADKLAAGLPDGMLPKDVEVLREANLGLAVELTAVTEQRDKLAEALENCRVDSIELLDERD